MLEKRSKNTADETLDFRLFPYAAIFPIFSSQLDGPLRANQILGLFSKARDIFVTLGRKLLNPRPYVTVLLLLSSITAFLATCVNHWRNRK